MRLLALAWLPLVLLAQDTESVPEEPVPVELPARAPIAGMPGLDLRSNVVFHEAPDQPHELAIVMIFPARARIELSARGSDWHARQREYQAGAHAYVVGSGEATSFELEDSQRAELFLRVELRRALMLWPDGPAWSGEGATRTRGVAGAGSLEVVLDDAGRPASMRALDAGGEELEAYSRFEWFEKHARTWPRAMDFSYRGTPVWREELIDVGVRPNFLDWFFLPADRRPTEPVGFDAAGAVRNTDLPPMVVRHVALEGERTWEELLEHAATLVTAARAELATAGLDVQDPVDFQLDGEGRVTHCTLRLAGPLSDRGDETPAGWTALAERPALTTFEHGPPGDLQALVRHMRKAAPTGSKPGRPYVRSNPAAGPEGRLQVVLPLAP